MITIDGQSTKNTSNLASMATLPLDILRLLPQWFDWLSYLSCLRVCKLWAKIFALPEKLPIYLQSWDYCDMPIMGMVAIGCQNSLPPIDTRIIMEVLEGGYDWVDGYSAGWFEVPKQEIFACLSQPKRRWSILACSQEPYLHEGLRIISSCNNVFGTIRTQYLVAKDRDDAKDDSNELQFSLGPLYPNFYGYPLPTIDEVDEGFFQYIIREVRKEKPLTAEYLYLTINQLGECFAVTYIREGKEVLDQRTLADMEPILFVVLNLRGGFRVCFEEEFPGEEVVNKIGRYALELHRRQS